MSTNVGGMTLPEFMPGGWDVNQMSMKVNDIERLLNSVDFTSTAIQCGRGFSTQRIRFTNGVMQKDTPLIYSMGNMIADSIPDNLSAIWLALLQIFPFAPTISGADVTLATGDVDHGKNRIVVSAETKTISANGQYTWVAYDTMAGTASWASPNTTKPTSTDTVWKPWIYKWNLSSGGNVTLAGIGHVGGTLKVPSLFGPD